MTDKLIEAIVEALEASDVLVLGDLRLVHARAALTAIEASGTHVIVPVEATEAMLDEAYSTTLSAPNIYAAMLSSRPKVI